MQVPIDPELITFGAYLVAAPAYLLLWRRHIQHCYVALAIACLILALAALLRTAPESWNLSGTG
jgi:hypothetical protein